MQTLSNRWLVAIAGVVVALIVASVAVALTNPRGGAETLPEDVPDGVVQRFILAMQDRDYSLAHSYLSDTLKESCTVEHIRSSSRRFADRSQDRRVALLETETLSDGRAQVRVRVTEVNVSPPFGVNERSYEQWYVLVQEGGEWRLDEPPPWPVGWCPGQPPEEIPKPASPTPD